MTKTVYCYDEKNYYEKSLTLDKSDISPSGRWNIPARCTEIEPLAEKEGYKVKWNGTGWEYEQEERPEPEPEPTFAELQQQKLREVDAWTASKITGGFVSSASGEPVTYDSDKDTQLTMQGIALNVNTELFAEKYPTGCPVRGYAQGAEEKTIYMLSAEQVMNWCADLSMHIGTCKQAGWAKQAEVQAATTKEELDAIVLD
jgi:hypothetical protein